MMGERLNTQNMLAKNRHSVCLGAGFNTQEPPSESNANRRSLSPSSTLKINAQDHIQKEHKVYQPNQLLKRGADTDEAHEHQKTERVPELANEGGDAAPAIVNGDRANRKQTHGDEAQHSCAVRDENQVVAHEAG